MIKRSRSRSGGEAVAFLVTFKGRFHTPALSGSVRRRKDRGLCTGLPVHQDVEEPPDLGELVEVEWEQCWASSVPQKSTHRVQRWNKHQNVVLHFVYATEAQRKMLVSYQRYLGFDRIELFSVGI